MKTPTGPAARHHRRMAIAVEAEDELAIPYWLTATTEAASASFGRMVRRLPGLIGKASRLAWATSPRTTLAVVAFQLGAGVAAGVGLVNVVGVLDGLLQAGPTPERIPAAVPSLLIMVAPGAVRTLLSSAATAAQGRLSPQVSQAAELRLLELTTPGDLAGLHHGRLPGQKQRGLQ